jgi:hypothetical protein
VHFFRQIVGAPVVSKTFFPFQATYYLNGHSFIEQNSTVRFAFIPMRRS